MYQPIPVTIVMVEDDEGHARLIEKNVRRAGVQNPIVPFADGSSALEFLLSQSRARNNERRGYLILLDLNLPDMSGVEVLKRIKEDDELKKAPVVVLTTTDDKVEIQRCYALGCNIYITKPVSYESFSRAILQLGLFLSVVQLPEIL